MKKNPIKEIARYCAANIEDYDDRVKIALGIMERMRCPLRVADGSLFDEMVDLAVEWFDNNEIAIEYDMDWEEFIEGEEGILWVEC